jgi:hypothetical protein
MNYTLRDPNGNVLLSVESTPVVTEADMKADLDKAAKACESAFDEVTKYQDAMAVMSSEGFGEQAKVVASKVWEKIREFFKWLKEWCKKIFGFIKTRIAKISNKLKIKLLSKSEVKQIEVLTMDELKKIAKAGEAFDPDARIDYSAVINRCKIITQQIQSIVQLLVLSLGPDSRTKLKDDIESALKYINIGKAEKDIDKLTDNYTNLKKFVDDLTSSKYKYSDEVAEKVKKDIDNNLEFDPNARITESTKDASDIITALSKMTDEWWDTIVEDYNATKDIMTSGADKMLSAANELQNYADNMLQIAQAASNSEFILAQKKAQYASLCNKAVKELSDKVNIMISVADKAASTNENLTAVKNMILAAQIKKDEKHDREVKLRDGPRVM